MKMCLAHRWVSLLAVVTALCAAGAVQAQILEETPSARTVALTFDDLPFAGTDLLEVAQVATDALLVALAAVQAPAMGFVVTGSLDGTESEAAARTALVEAWLRAGHRLENHSHTHPHYNTTETADYIADVAEGHRRLQHLVGTRKDQVRWYRAPYNEVGDTAAKRAALLDWLDDHDARLAPFTVEHADWLFDAVYTRALEAGDHDLAARVRTAYIEQLDVAFSFAEELARDTFGREIPQVLLLHANRLNADALPAMLDRLRARGYTFVPVDEAVADPAYTTTNRYEGKWGVSWLHRWRVGLGLPNRLRNEPEPPAWVIDAFEADS